VGLAFDTGGELLRRGRWYGCIDVRLIVKPGSCQPQNRFLYPAKTIWVQINEIVGTWPIATATFDGLIRPHTVLVVGREIHKTPKMCFDWRIHSGYIMIARGVYHPFMAQVYPESWPVSHEWIRVIRACWAHQRADFCLGCTWRLPLWVTPVRWSHSVRIFISFRLCMVHILHQIDRFHDSINDVFGTLS